MQCVCSKDHHTYAKCSWEKGGWGTTLQTLSLTPHQEELMIQQCLWAIQWLRT